MAVSLGECMCSLGVRLRVGDLVLLDVCVTICARACTFARVFVRVCASLCVYADKL